MNDFEWKKTFGCVKEKYCFFMNESKLWKQDLGLLIGREEQLGHSFTNNMTEYPVVTAWICS